MIPRQASGITGHAGNPPDVDGLLCGLVIYMRGRNKETSVAEVATAQV